MRMRDLREHNAPTPLVRQIYELAWFPFEASAGLLRYLGAYLAIGFSLALFFFVVALVGVSVTGSLTAAFASNLLILAVCFGFVATLAALLLSWFGSLFS